MPKNNVIRALGSEKRQQVLEWLRDPHALFHLNKTGLTIGWGDVRKSLHNCALRHLSQNP
jgi:hypothetical protein